ncbi:MAG: YtxH domain-containing protein [Ktedonobacterales bacterium]
MAKQKKKSGGGFMFGLIVGLAAGATLALLLAPQTGEETRETLAGQLRDRYGEAISQGREAYTRAKGEVLTRYSAAKAGQ